MVWLWVPLSVSLVEVGRLGREEEEEVLEEVVVTTELADTEIPVIEPVPERETGRHSRNPSRSLSPGGVC